MIFKRRDRRPCARMAITNLYRELDIFAGQIAPDPICPVDLEFVTDQIVNVANDYAICLGVEIDDVARTRRSARKSFTLTNGEEFDAVMFANEISINIVNLAAMKFVFAEVRTQKRFVIISRYETNFLAIEFVGHFQAQRMRDVTNLRFRHFAQRRERAPKLW